jgi:hypothetical protein
MLKIFVQQGRSSEADPRFTVLGSDARTSLADFFSILLGAGVRRYAYAEDLNND